MFAGHVGAALAIGRAERRVNVGVFILAALVADLVLWILVLAGVESARISPDYSTTHQVAFEFPYSHGLAATAVWSLLGGILTAVFCRRLGPDRWRAAGLVVAAVLSHWVLDALVHPPELPVAGAQSMKVGLNLWHTMPLAMTVEALIVVAGLALFIPGSKLSKPRRIGLLLFMALILALTIIGMTIAPAPPTVSAMAGSSIALILVTSALGFVIGRISRRSRPPV